MDIISCPLDANGNEITAFQNSRPTFGGHILPLIGNIYMNLLKQVIEIIDMY